MFKVGDKVFYNPDYSSPSKEIDWFGEGKPADIENESGVVVEVGFDYVLVKWAKESLGITKEPIHRLNVIH